MAGHTGGAGIQRSSASSTRARAAARNAGSGSAGTASSALGIGGGRGRRRLQFAPLVEDLDAPLGLLELRMAEAGELHAALVQRQRLLEGEIAFLELLDDRLELGDRRLEVFDGRFSHDQL